MDNIEHMYNLMLDGFVLMHNEVIICSYMQPPALDESVNLHFIALVHKEGHLYELG